MQLHQKILYCLHLRSTREFSDIGLQLVRFKERGHQLVVVSEGAVAHTLFREILEPGLLCALRRKTADLPLLHVKGLPLVPLDLEKKDCFPQEWKLDPRA